MIYKDIAEYEEADSQLAISTITKLHIEIERLNNIINELEKYCNENINFPIGCGITSDYGYAFENVLDKLKELKEKNNDNNKDNR